MINTLKTNAQKSSPGDLIELFDVDYSMLTGNSADVIRIIGNGDGYSNSVTWNSNVYTSMDMTASGFEAGSGGPAVSPTLAISTVNTAIQFNTTYFWFDLIGAEVTRHRTFSDCLADGTQFSEDKYRIDRIESLNKVAVVYSLEPATEVGKVIPGRLMLRDRCAHTYREWNGSSFDYSAATCPYAGATCYNSKNEALGVGNEDSDVCSKTIAGCAARFGEDNVLPAQIFPGVNRAAY